MLAACSTHFSKIFANAPLNGQLIVILDGTRSPDLQILLQFMYRGVAFLPSDRIESVLRTGEALQVSCVSVINLLLAIWQELVSERIEKIRSGT